jgi:hypothetical protein
MFPVTLSGASTILPSVPPHLQHKEEQASSGPPNFFRLRFSFFFFFNSKSSDLVLETAQVFE